MEYHDEHDYAMSNSETQTEEYLFSDDQPSKNTTYYLIPETQFSRLQSGNRIIIRLSDGEFEIKEVPLQSQILEAVPDNFDNRTDSSTLTCTTVADIIKAQAEAEIPIEVPIPKEFLKNTGQTVNDSHQEQAVFLPVSNLPEKYESMTDGYMSLTNEINAEFDEQVQQIIVSLPKAVSKKDIPRKRSKRQEIRLDPSCVDCGKTFLSIKDMLEHVMQEHPDKKPFRCEICLRRFSNLNDWRDHVQNHLEDQSNNISKDNIPKRMCESCGLSFPSVEMLREHKINDHRHEHSKICLICGMGFKKPSSLRVHIDRHNGNAKIQCEVCGKRFYRNADLKKHFRDIHEPNATRACFHCQEVVKVTDFYSHLRTHGPKPYHCQRCSESFARKVELKFHIKETHPNYKRHTCSVCSEGFNEKYQLDRHMTEHTGVYKYTCEVCSKGFTRKDQLDVHMVSHTGVLLFECDVCGKKFKRRDCLRSHRLIHSDERPFQCEICDSAFVTKDRLKKHLDKYKDMEHFECSFCTEKFHSEEQFEIHKVQEHYMYIEKLDEENPSLICSLCSKEYITKEFLINHLKSHFTKKNTHTKKYPRSKTTDAMHSCEICSKQFKCKAYLTDHLTTHSGEKRFECLVCGKKFAKSKYLSGHKKTHRGNHVFECEICSKKYLDKKAYERHVNQHTLNFSDESSVEDNSASEGDSEEDT